MDLDKRKDKASNQTISKIKTFKNLAGRMEYDLNQPQEYQIHIKVDNTVAHGEFIPSAVFPGQWRASEQTFKAMKKDLFALGDSLDELKDPYQCENCQAGLDRQFWIFCPYCGEPFREG